MAHNALMLSSHYLAIRLLHIGCVAFSATLFTARGLMRIADLAIANHVALRWLSYVVDTGLLGAAILLTLIVHQYPLVNGWLTVKVILLLLYIALGSIALRYARTRMGRSVAFVAAIVTFAYIVGVALAHDAAGWLRWVHWQMR
jgi:uncharacterized membrane protein SirB2